MPGGLIQLAAFGQEDMYLMGKPAITFFKTVFRQHTNFAQESVEVECEGMYNLSEVTSKPLQLKVKIPRVGDLLNKTFVKVELPHVFSSNLKKFKWVDHLGEAIIREAKLVIGGQEIEKITSDWLHIYHKLNLSDEKRKMYDMLIGNTPDMYNVECFQSILETLQSREFMSPEVPFHRREGRTEDADEMRIYEALLDHFSTILSYKDNIATDRATLQETRSRLIQTLPKSFRDLFHILKNISDYQDTQSPYYSLKHIPKTFYPSILSKTLYIPLPFFFSKDSRVSLPLIALQNQEVEIHLEINPIIYWYTILDWDKMEEKLYRRKPNPLLCSHKLSYFTYTSSCSSTSPHTLDDQLKGKIQYCCQEIDQCVEQDQVQILSSQVEIDGEASGPPTPASPSQGESLDTWDMMMRKEEVIQTHWQGSPQSPVRISMELLYTFLDEEERCKFAGNNQQYLIERMEVRQGEGYHGDNSEMNIQLTNPVKELIWVFKRDDFIQHNIHFNYTNWIYPHKPIWYNVALQDEFTKDRYQDVSGESCASYTSVVPLQKQIMKNAKLQFNGIDRFESKDAIYFNYLQPYLTHTNHDAGIYNYSFSLEPEALQPSGSVNMSMIQKVTLQFQTLVPPCDPKVKHELAKKTPDAKIANEYGFDQTTGEFNYLKDRDMFLFNYNLQIFSVHYNILNIASGTASLAYI